MNKCFQCLLIAVSLFVALGFVSAANAQKKKLSLPVLERIELDRNEVIIPCPPIRSPLMEDSPCFNDNGFVVAKATVTNPKNIPLSYNYTVSNGRIVGQGESVVWDLKGVRPGVYTITVAIEDSRGNKYETKSATITNRECGHCPMPCVCPFLNVTSKNAKAGEIFTFKAIVQGGTATDMTYDWTVSKGEIIAGQGTAEIKVKTTPEMTGSITASVEIGGSLCDNCRKVEAATAQIIE